jgi:hypothetical protein
MNKDTFEAIKDEKTKGLLHPSKLLEKIIDEWFKSDLQSAKKIYLLCGMAGAGKSTAMARLSVHKDVVACHFCDARYSETLQPLTFVVNISRCLCACIPEYKDWILANPRIEQLLADMDLGMAPMTPGVAFLKCVVAGLAGLKDVLAPKKIIIVDSLDEALLYEGADKKENILHIVRTYASRLPAWLYFVCTTRPQDAILQQLTQRFDARIDMEDYFDGQEMLEYIEQRIRIIVGDGNPPLTNILMVGIGELSAKISSFLSYSDTLALSFTSRACHMLVKYPVDKKYQNDFVMKAYSAINGNFLYARALFDELNRVFDGCSHSIIIHFPPQLNGLYFANFDRRFPVLDVNTQQVYDAATRQLLSVLVAAANPVPQHQLVSMLSVCSGSSDHDEVFASLAWLQTYTTKTRDIACPCHGDNIVTPCLAGRLDCSCTVSLTHQSVREWLVDSEQSHQFHVNPCTGLVYINMWHLYVLASRQYIDSVDAIKTLVDTWNNPNGIRACFPLEVVCCYYTPSKECLPAVPRCFHLSAAAPHIVCVMRSACAVTRQFVNNCATCRGKVNNFDFSCAGCTSCSSLLVAYGKVIHSFCAKSMAKDSYAPFRQLLSGLIKSNIDLPLFLETVQEMDTEQDFSSYCFLGDPCAAPRMLCQALLLCRGYHCSFLAYKEDELEKNIEAVAIDGNSALIEALLLCYPGFSIVPADGRGMVCSPLRLAILKGHQETVRVMLRLRPVNIEAPLFAGNSALKIARDKVMLSVLHEMRPDVALSVTIGPHQEGDVDEEEVNVGVNEEYNGYVFVNEDSEHDLYWEGLLTTENAYDDAFIASFRNELTRPGVYIRNANESILCQIFVYEELIFPLHILSFREDGGYKVLRILLDVESSGGALAQGQGLDFMAITSGSGLNALHCCAMSNNYQVLEILIHHVPTEDFDFLLNQGVYTDGNTALHIAAAEGNEQFVHVLLQFDRSAPCLHKLNAMGMSPISLSKTFAMAKLLLDYSERHYPGDLKNVGVLLSKPGIDVVTASLLVSHGADPNLPYPGGSNVIDDSVLQKSIRNVSYYKLMGKF